MESENNVLELSAPEIQNVEYAGFWARFLAVVLDSILLLVVSVPLLLLIYGPSIFFATESPGPVYDIINLGLPVAGFLAFWYYRSADPGKMMMGIIIVDADTFGPPSFGRLVLRYIGYYLSALPLLLGFLWAAFDSRKQGFHDKIAKTVVIKIPVEGNSQLAAEKPEAEKRVEPETTQVTPDKDPWKE